jgi:hypothetical protein
MHGKSRKGGGRHTDYKMFRKEEDKGQPYREAASIENANVSSTHGAKVMEKIKQGTNVKGTNNKENKEKTIKTGTKLKRGRNKQEGKK